MLAKRLSMFLNSFIWRWGYIIHFVSTLWVKKNHNCPLLLTSKASLDTHCNLYMHWARNLIELSQKMSREEIRHLRNRLSENILKEGGRYLKSVRLQMGRQQCTDIQYSLHPSSLLSTFSLCCVPTATRTWCKPGNILVVFVSGQPNLWIHCHIFTLYVALCLAASPDPRGGLLEDAVVSCCEAGATYVCGTWFPWGNRLIGYGCWGPVVYLWTLP